MNNWPDICSWRNTTRQQLLQERLSWGRDARADAQDKIGALLAENLDNPAQSTIGFYWPIRGEVDIRLFIRVALALGAETALPVVTEKRKPLEFWQWHSETNMTRGVWNIPVSADRHPVRPTVVLVPLLGFDQRGYRLGNGGGYYDRTLVPLDPEPIIIGVGFECGRLPTIYPQPHDIPMHVLVTESGWSRMQRLGESTLHYRRDADEEDRMKYASSPCYAHEFDDERN